MTVEQYPILDTVTLAAKNWRRMAQALGGGPAAAFAGGVGAVHPMHGVTGPTDLKVTQASTPAMKVQVAAGVASIVGTVSAEQGPYALCNDGALELTVAAANATNPRRDLVIAQVQDASYSGAANGNRLFVVTGTPAAAPADPSLAAYPNALVLARVTVPAAATSITNANITDLRIGVGPWFGPAGKVAGATQAASTAANAATTTVLSATSFTAQQYRRYRITVQCLQAIQVGAGQSELQVWRSTTNQLNACALATAAGTVPGSCVVAEDTPGAGAVIYNMRTFTSGTSVQLIGTSGAPLTVIVDDAGGFLA